MEFSEQKVKERRQLSLMISLIYEAGLINSEQKIKIEEKTHPNDIRSEIFKLLMTTESVKSTDVSKMFLLLRSVEKYGKYNSYSITHNQVVHPLKTDTVIRNVFRFLSLEDIKNCRLVNKKWRDESELFLRKQSRIKFNCYSKTPAMFNVKFPRDMTLPFTSFKFTNIYEEDEWRISTLEQFFEQQGANIMELELDYTTLINENNEDPENYDISHWIAASAIKKLNIYSYGLHLVAITLNRFNSLKYINFIKTSVNIWKENANRIAPVNIKLTNVVFYDDGNKLNVRRINDDIDFSNAEEISLVVTSADQDTTRLILDLAETFDVRVVSLSEVMVLNWTISKCSAETVVLKDINFVEKTAMKIKKFIFEGNIIDLYGLPSTLEMLSLKEPTVDILCTQPIALPLLKTLSLIMDSEYDLEVLTHFKNCENLINIALIGHFSMEMEDSVLLDLIWIPNSVKYLTMNKIDRIHGGLDLEILTLDNYSLSAAAKILSKIKPKKLVLLWDKEYEANDSIIKFMETFPDITISIKPIRWEDGEFETSQLANYVDKMANKYIFKNNKGQSVEFDIEDPVDFSN